MNPARIATCEECGWHGLMACKWERYEPAIDLWHPYFFCDGKCCGKWLRERNLLPNPGIVTTLRHVPGQERG